MIQNEQQPTDGIENSSVTVDYKKVDITSFTKERLYSLCDIVEMQMNTFFVCNCSQVTSFETYNNCCAVIHSCKIFTPIYPTDFDFMD